MNNTPRTARHLDRHTSFWRTVAAMLAPLRHDLLSGYRPERHYMRGPGPKWHAKQMAGGA